MSPLWSWVLTGMGVTCFWLAGRKVWWAWYVGLATQCVWAAYAITTTQWGFLAGCAVYTWVYWGNTVRWTREHREAQRAALGTLTTAGGFADPGPLTPKQQARILRRHGS